MARVELVFDHVDNHGYVYFKPVDDDDGKASVLVNQTLVKKHFYGIPPEHAKLTLVVDSAERGPVEGA